VRYPLLGLLLLHTVAAFAQNDSCGCFSLRPQPDLNYSGRAYSVYTNYEGQVPYTGICHTYHMLVPGKIPDYTKTYQYGRFRNGEMLFWVQLNDNGDTISYFHRTVHDSIIAEEKHYDWSTGRLESWGYYYYTSKQKLLKVYGYSDQGFINSESNFFFPDSKDSLNYGESFINYHEDSQLGSDGFFSLPVQEGPFFEYWDAEHHLKTSGGYHGNSKSGKWTTWFNSGQIESQGSYTIHNWKDGNWKEWYVNGQMKSEIDYCTSNPCGTYREWYDNGNLRTEQKFSGNPRNGTYEEFWENGKIKRRDTYEEGHLTKLEYWYSNGQKTSENFYSFQGRPVGQFRSWYDNGNVQAETHFDTLGNHDASEKEYYANGVLKHEVAYADHVRCMERRYYESGQLKSEEPYSGYSRHGRCYYYFPSGKIQNTTNYKDGRKDGNSKTFDENGILLSDLNCSHGKWEGTCQWFFENGKLYRTGNYSGSVRNGLFREWNRQGALVYQQTYLNGKPANDNKAPLQITKYSVDSLRNLFTLDVEVMAGAMLNNQDSTYTEMFVAQWKKDRMLSDLLSVSAFIPPSLDSVMMVHSDSSQIRTHVFLDYPLFMLSEADTDACQSWPIQLNPYIQQLHLVPVEGECYGDDDQGIRRGFTSELFFNGKLLNVELRKINDRLGCEYFTPNSSDPDPHNSGINVNCYENFNEYYFHMRAQQTEWQHDYVVWAFRVYPDGSVDYLEDAAGYYSWAIEN